MDLLIGVKMVIITLLDSLLFFIFHMQTAINAVANPVIVDEIAIDRADVATKDLIEQSSARKTLIYVCQQFDNCFVDFIYFGLATLPKTNHIPVVELVVVVNSG